MTISSSHATRLGELMCDVTREVLWSPTQDWIKSQAPGSSLRCRVGSGNATYHRYDPRDRQHQITFGKRMIVAKHSAVSAHEWLSGREIRRRGYFDGEVTTLNLLAHTCCHEFAHLLQHVIGKRFRGSVHNRHFYGLLDDLYQSGKADSARNLMTELARKEDLTLPQEVLEQTDTGGLTATWQAGDRVRFGSQKRPIEGIVRRVNRKTCTVDACGRHRGTRYRVPMALLRALPN